MSSPSPLQAIPPSAQPWSEPDCFVQTPTSDYGYWVGGFLKSSTREHLIDAIRTDKDNGIQLVAVPEQPRLVVPEEVGFLRDALVARGKLHARQSLGLPVLGLIACWGIALYAAIEQPAAVLRWVFLGFFFGGATLLSRLFDMWRLRRYPVQPTTDQIAGARFETWLAHQTAPTDWALIGVLVAVGVVQIVVGLERSVAAAGIVKPAVWGGAPWRLLTGALLHGSLMHWWSNAVALAIFAALISRLADGRAVPVVFVVAALAGSVASLLGTQTTSVGASGGILGLVGFLGALLWARRATLPTAAFRPVLEVLALVVLLGGVGYQYIDNWAHLGGLVAGAVLGAFYQVGAPATFPVRIWPLARLAALAAYGVIVGAGWVAIAAMLGKG